MPAPTIPQDRTSQPAQQGQLPQLEVLQSQSQLQPHTPESNLSDSESLQNALDDDDNAQVPMRYPALREAFLTSLEDKKDVIEATVRLHLGVRSCHLSVREVWRSGSFNVVLPILIPQNRTAFMRIPFPYRIGEDHCPGNVEEKLRTEIATYIWLRQNCPDIPIPELHAFGLPDGSTFTHPLHTPFWEKAWWTLKRFGCSLLGRPVPVHHVKRTIRHSIAPGFLLISEARGKKLAWSWLDHYDKKAYRDRLFRSLARISLSLKAIPFPRIGSVRLQPDGTVALCNRPLSLYLQMLENEGIPTDIPRHRLYAQVESYLSDLLSFQDNKVRHQPNAVHDEEDGKMQLAAARGSFWYFHAVRVPKGMYTLFNRHIKPLFNKEHPGRKIFDEVFYWYWGSGAEGLIEKKLGDRKEYEASVRAAFKEGSLKKQL